MQQLLQCKPLLCVLWFVAVSAECVLFKSQLWYLAGGCVSFVLRLCVLWGAVAVCELFKSLQWYMSGGCASFVLRLCVL